MNPKKQNARLAELAKWAKRYNNVAPTPNYLHDLNAMRVAEVETLFGEGCRNLRNEYEDRLFKATSGNPWNAPAIVRAEQLLKTLGEWE